MEHGPVVDMDNASLDRFGHAYGFACSQVKIEVARL
jgi:hypothetical protein